MLRNNRRSFGSSDSCKRQVLCGNEIFQRRVLTGVVIFKMAAIEPTVPRSAKKYSWEDEYARVTMLAISVILCLSQIDKLLTEHSRDGILGHQFNTRLEAFAPLQSTGGFSRKSYSSLVWKSLQKNPRNKKTRFYSWTAFCRTENEGREPDKPDMHRNRVQKFHLKSPWRWPLARP
jgi:hypothetical protein